MKKQHIDKQEIKHELFVRLVSFLIFLLGVISVEYSSEKYISIIENGCVLADSDYH